MCRAPDPLYEILQGELDLKPLRLVANAFLLAMRRIAEAFED
jgi:hypothetical protein